MDPFSISSPFHPANPNNPNGMNYILAPGESPPGNEISTTEQVARAPEPDTPFAITALEVVCFLGLLALVLGPILSRNRKRTIR